MAKWNYWTFGELVARTVSDACGLVRKPSTSYVNSICDQRKELYLFVRAMNEITFDHTRNIAHYFHRDYWVSTFEFTDLCDALAVPSLTAH